MCRGMRLEKQDYDFMESWECFSEIMLLILKMIPVFSENHGNVFRKIYGYINYYMCMRRILALFTARFVINSMLVPCKLYNQFIIRAPAAFVCFA